MRITLENFRCYSNQTFDFGDGGLALLSGGSGTGKTTIMLAIQFALVGDGTKLVSHGSTKKGCRVVMEFDGMTIDRTTSPKKLIVNEKYQDAEGQAVINAKFGDTFKVTGYIAQNPLHSFVMKSPIDKLAFLEKYAFGDMKQSITDMKQRSKNHTKLHDNNLIKAKSELEMATQWLNDCEVPEKVEFPIKCGKSKEKKEHAYACEITKFANCKTRIKRSDTEFKKVNTELTSVRVLDATIKAKEESVTEFLKELSGLEIEESTIVYEGDDYLDDLEYQLDTVVTHAELVTLRKEVITDTVRLEGTKEQELTACEKKIESIRNSLWSEDSHEECNDIILDLEQQIRDLVKLESLEKELKSNEIGNLSKKESDKEETSEELRKNRDIVERLERQGETYACPSCSSTLRVADGTLQLASDTVPLTGNISELRQAVTNGARLLKRQDDAIVEEKRIRDRRKVLENEIKDILSQYDGMPTRRETEDDLDNMRDYRSSNLNSEKRLSRLINDLSNGDSFSATYVSMAEALKLKISRLDDFDSDQEDVDNDISEADLRFNINKQKQAKIDLERINSRMDKLNIMVAKQNKDMVCLRDAHIKDYSDLKDIDQLVEDVARIQCEITARNVATATCEKTLARMDEWKTYNIAYEKRMKMVKNVEAYAIAETQCCEKYAASTLLETTILEAEFIAMSNVVKSIDNHAQVYLDEFFPDNPLTSRLEMYKMTKNSSKHQVNIVLEYKGMECDMSTLSGGETSRVVLAYTLALSEIYNTPLILLDECTASLDEELTATVFDGIRENFSGKLVIIVAHQCVSGIFDTLITLQ